MKHNKKQYLFGIVLIVLLVWIDRIHSQDLTIASGKTNTITIGSTSKTLYTYIDNASAYNFWMDLKINLVSFDKEGSFSVTVTHTDTKVPANSFKKTFQLTKSNTSNRVLQQITPGSVTRFVQIDILPPSGLTSAQMEVYVKFGDYPLSEGDIIGIVIGSCFGALIIAFFGSFYLQRLKTKRQRITIKLLIDVFFESIRDLGILGIRFLKNLKDALAKLDCNKPASESETPHHIHIPDTQPVQNYNYNTNQHVTTTASNNANIVQEDNKEKEEAAVQYYHNNYDEIEQVDPIQVNVELQTAQVNLKQDLPKHQETHTYQKQELAPAYEDAVRYEPPMVDPIDYAQMVLPQPTPTPEDNGPRIPRVFVPQAVTPSPILPEYTQSLPQNQQDNDIVIPNIPLPANLV